MKLTGCLSFLVRIAWGPLARDMDSVVLMSKILLVGPTVNEIDPLGAPCHFNEQVNLNLLSSLVHLYTIGVS